jgi:hypothetical protein
MAEAISSLAIVSLGLFSLNILFYFAHLYFAILFKRFVFETRILTILFLIASSFMLGGVILSSDVFAFVSILGFVVVTKAQYDFSKRIRVFLDKRNEARSNAILEKRTP